MNTYAYINLNSVFKSFYCSPKLDFSKVTEERIKYLVEQAEKLNAFFNNERFNSDITLKYIRIMERINGASSKTISNNVKFATKTAEEKFLLLIYTVDPNFDAAIINLSEDRIINIKRRMIKKFGLYDPNLIKLELKVIRQLLSKEKRKEIYDTAEKIAFK